MTQLFLLALPLLSYTFFFESTNLPRLNITLFDFVVPILCFYFMTKNKKLWSELFKENIYELMFVLVALIGASLILLKEHIHITNTLKDLYKNLLFIMAIHVYKRGFSEFKLNSTYFAALIFSSFIILYLRHDPTQSLGYLHVTPMTNYAFYIWLLYTFVQNKNVSLYVLTTLALIIELAYLKRSELMGFVGITLVVYTLDKFNLSKRQLLNLIIAKTVILFTFGIFFYEVILRSLTVRLTLWDCAIKLSLKNLPWGLGLGQYQAQTIVPCWAENLGVQEYDKFQYPHNQFIYWMAEMGFVGIILGVLFMFIVFKHIRQTSIYWKLGLGAICLVASMTHDIMSFRIFPIFLGVLYVISRQQNDKKLTTKLL